MPIPAPDCVTGYICSLALPSGIEYQDDESGHKKLSMNWLAIILSGCKERHSAHARRWTQRPGQALCVILLMLLVYTAGAASLKLATFQCDVTPATRRTASLGDKPRGR